MGIFHKRRPEEKKLNQKDKNIFELFRIFTTGNYNFLIKTAPFMWVEELSRSSINNLYFMTTDLKNSRNASRLSPQNIHLNAIISGFLQTLILPFTLM